MKILTASLLLVLAVPAYAETAAEKTGVNSMMGISPTTQDFVTEAAISDMFEIQSSELATTKSSDAATKAFAEHMIKDHTKTTGDLTTFVSSGKVNATLPNKMDSSHQSKIDKLKSLSGDDFTKQYHSDQDSGHKDAVSLFKRYSDGGDNPDLKAWAAKTLPTLQTHLDEAKALDH